MERKEFIKKCKEIAGKDNRGKGFDTNIDGVSISVLNRSNQFDIQLKKNGYKDHFYVNYNKTNMSYFLIKNLFA